MAIIKNKAKGQYTNISQQIMTDTNLSLSERGMLLTLLSLPSNWNFTIRGLCTIIPDGKAKISSTLNSLIEKGYVSRRQSRAGKGKFDSTDLIVNEIPVKPSDKDNSPHPENRVTVKRDTENQSQYNTYISITNKDKVNGYPENRRTTSGSSKPKPGRFFDFPQREIDFEELERNLVKN